MISKGLKDLFAKDQPREGSQEAVEQRNLFFSNNAPSWEELKTLSMQKGAEIGDVSLTQVIGVCEVCLFEIADRKTI